MRQRSRAIFLLGPAFVAAIAYVDPGNVAANVAAGGEYGYLLIWVLVLANAMAVFVQYQSAKLGIVTGRSLPELLGSRLSTAPRRLYWVQAELVAAATDVAEVIGGAVALNLLFGLPLVVGGVIVGLASMAILSVQSRRGQRTFETVIIGLLAVIAIGFLAGVTVSHVDWAAAAGGLVPRFDGPPTILLAASMLGATVMPHVIYLHSALARDRHGHQADEAVLRRLLRITRWDVLAALAFAGAVNIGMLLLAAAGLHGSARLVDAAGNVTLDGVYEAVEANLGPVIAVAFAIGLLASSLASSTVGNYAGATIMGGLVRVRVPSAIRRGITLIPALVLLALAVDPTSALILSQVLLSLGIPFALIPLLRLTADARVMGLHADRLPMRITGWVIATLIVSLNVVLVALTFAQLW